MAIGDDPVANGRSGTDNAHQDPLGRRLDGWKTIAGHLGRDIRTVQRWELHEGLPIHRLEHRQRASAYAFTGELDGWVANRVPHPEEGEPGAQPAAAGSRRWRIPIAVASLLALVVIAGLQVRVLRSKPAGTDGDTKSPQAYSAFAEGSALYAARRYRDAAIALERAVSLDPSYGLAWACLGKTYGRLSQPMWAGGKAAADRAVDAAAHAGSLAPSAAETHVALSLSARAQGDVARWRAEAHKALELDPRAAEALGLLGDSYSAYVYGCHRDQDPALAESFYRRAMELRPSQTTVVDNRAHNLRRMRRYSECVDLMNRSIAAFPDETPLRAERGACRLLAGDVRGAAEDISVARDSPKIAPAGALVYLGLLELKTGRVADGTRDLEAVFKLDQSARAELVVAEAYGLAGEVEQATTHLKRAFGLDSTCAGMVASSIAFEPIREAEPVKTLLASYQVR